MAAQEPIRARRILLADADAFYVAVARYVDPDGAGREPLLIVGGSPDGRGVVTSASYEARAYGVRSAMPTAQALRLCPGAVVAPVPRDVCVQKSREILAVLRDFSPVVEPASIDEFYVDLDGTEQLYHEPLAVTAIRIRDRVLEVTTLSVSIGGGTSKLIAKLAAKLAKPRPDRDGDGVHIVPAGTEGDFMATFDLAAIPMIGPRFQERLTRYGLRTVPDVLRHDQRTLEGWFGKRSGAWLYNRVRGRDQSRVTDPGRKSVSHEMTFARDLDRPEDLDHRLVQLAGAVARDLRHKGRKARTITVKIRDADFTTRQASHTLPEAVNTDRVLLDTSRDLLDRLRRARRRPARLLGVGATQLTPKGGGEEQLGLFEDGPVLESPRDRQLARLMDGITDRFGHDSMRRGIEVRKKKTTG